MNQLLESKLARASAREHRRALPQVPSSTTNNPQPSSRPRLNIPAADEAQEDDDYSDIRGIISRTRASGEDDGHYTDIHSVVGRRTSYWQADDPYHYIDIDRQNTRPAGGNQSVPSRGYEGLDPAVLSTHRPSQRRHNDYAGLVGTAQAAAQRGTDIEMTNVDDRNQSGTAVSQLLPLSSSSSCSLRHDTIRRDSILYR